MKIKWHRGSEKPNKRKTILAKVRVKPFSWWWYVVLRCPKNKWIVGFTGENLFKYGLEVIEWAYLPKNKGM